MDVPMDQTPVQTQETSKVSIAHGPYPLAKMLRTIPVLAVKDMRASLAFWEDVLGFERIIETSKDGMPDTVHLARDQVEVICRSVDALPPGELPYSISTVRVEVANLQALIPRLAQAGFGSGAEGNGLPSVFEIPVNAPGGHRIVLAQIHQA